MIWKAAMVDPALRAVFDALEINAADAWALFQQLDTATCLKLRKTRDRRIALAHELGLQSVSSIPGRRQQR